MTSQAVDSVDSHKRRACPHYPQPYCDVVPLLLVGNIGILPEEDHNIHSLKWYNFLGKLPLLIVGLVHVTTIPNTGWQPIVTANRPSPRIEAEIAYDLNRGKAVLFGGVIAGEERTSRYSDETWEWHGSDWVQCFPEVNPPGRTKHAMAYDAVRGVVVMFGGHNGSKDLGDTWEWDGKDWVQRYPETNPPARCCHAMTYDTQRGRVVLYGGYYGEGNFLDKAWEWDGEDWIPIFFETEEPTTSGNDLVYYELLDRTVVVRLGRTWIWQGNSWSKLQMDVEPTTREHEGMVYDPAGARVVLFGGINLDNDRLLDDTWVLENQVWRQLDLPLSPNARWGHMMFYDQNRGQVIIFGGVGRDGKYLDDMWELILADDG